MRVRARCVCTRVCACACGRFSVSETKGITENIFFVRMVVVLKVNVQ